MICPCDSSLYDRKSKRTQDAQIGRPYTAKARGVVGPALDFKFHLLYVHATSSREQCQFGAY